MQGLIGFALVAVCVVLAIAWVFLPILLYSRLGSILHYAEESANIQKQQLAELQRIRRATEKNADFWDGRNVEIGSEQS